MALMFCKMCMIEMHNSQFTKYRASLEQEPFLVTIPEYRTSKSYIARNYLDPPRFLLSPAAAFENQNEKQNKSKKAKRRQQQLKSLPFLWRSKQKISQAEIITPHMCTYVQYIAVNSYCTSLREREISNSWTKIHLSLSHFEFIF